MLNSPRSTIVIDDGRRFLERTQELFDAISRPLWRQPVPAPPAAARDMLEWGTATTVESQFQKMLRGEIPLRRLIDADPGAPALTNDRPVNEYYFLRSLARGRQDLVP